MKTAERKYHYWRGFAVATLIFVTLYCLINIFYKPDYTMTQDQYQEYLYSCTSQ